MEDGIVERGAWGAIVGWTWNRRKWDRMLRMILRRVVEAGVGPGDRVLDELDRRAISLQGCGRGKYRACLEEVQRLYDCTGKHRYDFSRFGGHDGTG